MFDAGVTGDGRPFFVMEHVAGVPLNEYCDRNHLAAALGSDDWRTGEARSLLGACLVAQGRHGEAEPLLVDGHALLERHRGGRYRRTRLALERVVSFYERVGRPREAARYRTAREPRPPPD